MVDEYALGETDFEFKSEEARNLKHNVIEKDKTDKPESDL